MDQKGLLASVFDLSFREFITVRVMRFVFVLLIVFSGLMVLFFIGAGFSQGAAIGVIFLILAPLLFLLYVLGARIWCELTVVVFRIAENTERLVKEQEAPR